MEDAFELGSGSVHPAVDVERRGLDLARARAHLAIDRDPEQIARPELAEMAAVGVDQELAAVVGQRQAEMVVDALVQAEPHGQAKRRRQLDPADALEIVHRFAPAAGGKCSHGRGFALGQ